MHIFGNPGERQICILSSGNLATTQAVITQLKQDIKRQQPMNLLTMENISDAADYVGEINRTICAKQTTTNNGINFEAYFILGGQIGSHQPALRLIYPQGNHITTSDSTPFLQIGESKYGKPILDRIIKHDTSLETASVCSLVSMDSTINSNLTVGPPIEILIYDKDSLAFNRRFKFEEDSEYLKEVKRQWNASLVDAFNKLPPINWSSGYENNANQSGQDQGQSQ